MPRPCGRTSRPGASAAACPASAPHSAARTSAGRSPARLNYEFVTGHPHARQIAPDQPLQPPPLTLNLPLSGNSTLRIRFRFVSNDNKHFDGAYVDDIIIFSKTFEEHLEHISQVLARVIKADLRIKLEKCSFAVHEVRFLGGTGAVSAAVRPAVSQALK